MRILNLTSVELQQALQNGSLQAVDVLHVYQSRVYHFMSVFMVLQNHRDTAHFLGVNRAHFSGVNRYE